MVQRCLAVSDAKLSPSCFCKESRSCSHRPMLKGQWTVRVATCDSKSILCQTNRLSSDPARDIENGAASRPLIPNDGCKLLSLPFNAVIPILKYQVVQRSEFIVKIDHAVIFTYIPQVEKTSCMKLCVNSATCVAVAHRERCDSCRLWRTIYDIFIMVCATCLKSTSYAAKYSIR